MNEVFDNQQQKNIEKFSQSYLKKKLKSLGHDIRADNEDPLRQVTFKEGNVKGARLEKRRAGKPTIYWTWEGKTQVWKKFRHEFDQPERRKPNKRRKYKGKWSQDVDIINLAIDRTFQH